MSVKFIKLNDLTVEHFIKQCQIASRGKKWCVKTEPWSQFYVVFCNGFILIVAIYINACYTQFVRELTSINTLEMHEVDFVYHHFNL